MCRVVFLLAGGVVIVDSVESGTGRGIDETTRDSRSRWNKVAMAGVMG